jgi:hypothetical protein
MEGRRHKEKANYRKCLKLKWQNCGFEVAQLSEVMNVRGVEISYPHPT